MIAEAVAARERDVARREVVDREGVRAEAARGDAGRDALRGRDVERVERGDAPPADHVLDAPVVERVVERRALRAERGLERGERGTAARPLLIPDRCRERRAEALCDVLPERPVRLARIFVEGRGTFLLRRRRVAAVERAVERCEIGERCARVRQRLVAEPLSRAEERPAIRLRRVPVRELEEGGDGCRRHPGLVGRADLAARDVERPGHRRPDAVGDDCRRDVVRAQVGDVDVEQPRGRDRIIRGSHEAEPGDRRVCALEISEQDARLRLRRVGRRRRVAVEVDGEVRRAEDVGERRADRRRRVRGRAEHTCEHAEGEHSGQTPGHQRPYRLPTADSLGIFQNPSNPVAAQPGCRSDQSKWRYSKATPHVPAKRSRKIPKRSQPSLTFLRASSRSTRGPRPVRAPRRAARGRGASSGRGARRGAASGRAGAAPRAT